MKVSASMYSLHATVQEENWSIVDFIHYAKRAYLDGVELLDFYWKAPVDNHAELQEVLNALQETNLPVCAYDVSNNFVKDTAEARKEEVNKIIRGIQTAKALGTNIVRVFCGDLSGKLTYEDGQEWIVEGLKECAAIAEKEDVYLAVENHGLLAGKSEQIKGIIERVNSPFVKATFDTGNFLLVHQDPKEAFAVLKDDIVHVHFKDFRAKQADETITGFKSTQGVEMIGVIPGDGVVDLAYIVNGLKDIAYDGWLSIEYEGYEDAKTANEEAVSRLRKLFI